jgi:hypothetical protein
MKWPGQDLGKVPEDAEFTYTLVGWLRDYAAEHHGKLTVEQIFVSLERARFIITERIILKRPFRPS